MKYLILILLLSFSTFVHCQVFEVDKTESFFYLAGMTATTFSINHIDVSALNLAKIDKNDIPFFDSSSPTKYDGNLKEWSNNTIYLTMASSAFIIADKNFVDNFIILGKVLLTQDVITKLSKAATHRKRPFVYDNTVSDATKQSRNAQHSFYSGHSSTAFAAATFGYYYYSQKYGKNAWIATLLFGGASATAYLRVASAQHFPSDVTIGAIAGSAISYGICKYHQSDNFNVSVSLNQVNFCYEF
ncbi:MAG: phosphatase PAP2 family protein [Candidatus Cloacimonetes bacterium]|jgi:membrane-associated phospholipid phosphatase|nr:phosphatase PAP2 family protein [Candidatus Cloacimonadota bacterium]MBT6993959.1 phosphatase PAP2 family protein [Candidatus Cloacimonadota bacterium]MBT7469765.1 phosphatase PAP2 family protein [Candidatus Cloacimonadota bacterium]